MRIYATIFILVVVRITTTSAQGNLTSSVYAYPDMKSGSQKNLLKGATSYFKSYQVEVFSTKAKGLSGTTSNDTEELVIVKQGKLTVTLGDNNKVLGPGSIAFIMPGEKYKIQQEGSVESIFYRLRATSKSTDARERGKTNGGSFVIDFGALEFKPSERGGRRDYFDKPTAVCDDFEMHMTTLNEGLPSHPPHTHPQEEIILLMKGDATMAINNKDYDISTGSLVFLAAGDLHGIRNRGKGQCEYFAFQWK